MSSTLSLYCAGCGAVTSHAEPCRDGVQRCDVCYVAAKRAGILDARGYPIDQGAHGLAFFGTPMSAFKRYFGFGDGPMDALNRECCAALAKSDPYGACHGTPRGCAERPAPKCEIVLAYLPANQAWAFTFGRTDEPYHERDLLRIGDGAMFYSKASEAREAAIAQGLVPLAEPKGHFVAAEAQS